MTDEEKALCKKAISENKEIRPVVQFGDLYRLVSPYDNQGLSSIMYVSEAKDNRADFLILRNGFLAKRLLFISHILRLDFHTQTTAHRHINTILQGSGTEDGMIRNRRDMACHSDGWKEIAGSPVGSTTTTRTALDNYIFISCIRGQN